VRGAAVLSVVAAAGLWLAVSASAAPAPWQSAGDVRLALSDAEAELVLGDSAHLRARLEEAETGVERVLADKPAARASARQALARAGRAARRGDEAAFAAARATVWTTILAASFDEAVRAAAAGDAVRARGWLLVREFRPPTRFSRAAADATLALDALADKATTPAKAAAAVRTDLLDTYDARLRAALASVRDADRSGLTATRAEAAALAQGYWRLVGPAFRSQRGAAAAARAERAFATLAAAPERRTAATLARADRALEGFRAAPLAPEELVRRAGQLERFLKLVPIEYDRGVENGRVTLDFEIQEAITFRDGAAGAFRDLEPVLLRRDAASTRGLAAALEAVGDDLAAAGRGTAVAGPETVRARTDEALRLAAVLYPDAWKEAAKTADFDVIAATLDRVEAAAASGEWGRAEQARLEAYGIFELGPEQRLRGLAPSLFQEIEGLFWYGEGGHDGLVQLVKRKASAAELQATRAALDEKLRDAEERIGSGPQSRAQIVTNAAIIVFREGLEAVLILAALMASMVGPQRRYRRPLLVGVSFALLASVATWVVAQTLLTSLAGFGERLEAIVSLVAIAVLLVILNWFYHRVYWQENLQDLHKRKKRILAGAGLSLAAAQVAGLVALGFSSVYREGFETVLFLQALTLEAGALTVLEGVALGFAAVVAVFFLVVALERKLPHKKMLIATGVLITWVLVVMVGTTVQTLQKVGWVPVTPIEGLQLPYWSGLWLGIYPTWEGMLAQVAAATFVVGSYVLAERLRARRRARILEPQTAVAEARSA
jgi:high-affinity iron transporter